MKNLQESRRDILAIKVELSSPHVQIYDAKIFFRSNVRGLR
jgi:hypothetical protein